MEHALSQLEVTEPDPVDPDLEHQLARIPEFGSRLLRMIINVQRTPPLVVTVFFDRSRTML